MTERRQATEIASSAPKRHCSHEHPSDNHRPLSRRAANARNSRGGAEDGILIGSFSRSSRPGSTFVVVVLGENASIRWHGAGIRRERVCRVGVAGKSLKQLNPRLAMHAEHSLGIADLLFGIV